ncbi:hypothetical protein CpipJ_CPIJ009718 [Culex quinquefasciatus]|uniref:Uncharacterized protein n=1 Tax=Culex quinquefasciatus TaxID=7176 RepID=B0WS32_CULQU|nr:hypothetical protein CpipJ_CPIJ009718 [Culex quinquefasciatus]|eukprot:XP_001851516.1 hypothetical protein CpipJ_CPIJ009718 [Culex quinquefasciatus]
MKRESECHTTLLSADDQPGWGPFRDPTHPPNRNRNIPTASKVYSHVDSVQVMAADAAMDTTCPSPELGDSRKRPLDDGTLDDGTSKRSHFSTNGPRPHQLPPVQNEKPGQVDRKLSWRLHCFLEVGSLDHGFVCPLCLSLSVFNESVQLHCNNNNCYHY